MSLLSNDDIKRELGKNIFIYPLYPGNIKGSSLNLTASPLAWSLKTKESALNEGGKAIVIPPHDTVLVETDESVYVSRRISGSFHSKVNLVSQGIGHVGTTLDPGWIGSSLIALHNHSSDPIQIEVGDTIVSIMLFYLGSTSSRSSANYPGRPELLNQFKLTSSEQRWLDVVWRNNPQELKRKMEDCSEFKRIVEERQSRHKIIRSPISINLICLTVLILVGTALNSLKSILGIDTKDFLIPIVSIYLSILTSQLIKLTAKS